MARLKIGRKTQVIDCRETAGLGLGGGLAQRDTFSEAEEPDVIVLSMGPSSRHITKPVCEITYGLREEGIQTSVMVMRAGVGATEDRPLAGGGISGINPQEEEKLRKHKLVIIHLGNVFRHFVYKARTFLKNVDIPAIIICQAPVGFEDFAKAGVLTEKFHPDEFGVPKMDQTKGKVVDIVSGVIRGQTCPQFKINEILEKVNYWLTQIKFEKIKKN